jgi:hypothetical protein
MSYFQSSKSAIVRIFHSQSVIGAGFLISDRHLLTCAHVVTAALGVARDTAIMPEGEVEFDLPLLLPGQRMAAKVIFWRGVQEGQVGEDIAVLEVGALPTGARSVRLVKADEPWGHSFRIFGFPVRRDEGIWAGGVLREHGVTQWVQMEGITAQGYAIEPGFSGAPVWDESLEGVVGMAVAAERDREEAKAAFMIPVSVLQLSGALEHRAAIAEVQVSSAVDAVSLVEVKRRAISKNYQILCAQYEAAYNQKSMTLNLADVPVLEAQIVGFEKKIEQCSLELKKLEQ